VLDKLYIIGDEGTGLKYNRGVLAGCTRNAVCAETASQDNPWLRSERMRSSSTETRGRPRTAPRFLAASKLATRPDRFSASLLRD